MGLKHYMKSNGVNESCMVRFKKYPSDKIYNVPHSLARILGKSTDSLRDNWAFTGVTKHE